jgi:membrane-bound lytic murein transglycosylase D
MRQPNFDPPIDRMLEYVNPMPSFRRGLAGVVCAVGLISGCAARTPQTSTQVPPQVAASEPSSAPLPQPTRDPIQELIAQSEEHYQTGERELREGHLDAARISFDRAVDVILESPGGARSNPELSAHFDRLVERISGHELSALAQADGFAEKAPEPASIDALLSIPTFEVPAPSPETERAVADDLQAVTHDIDIPQNSRVLAYVELFTGRLKGYLEDGLSRGAQYLPMIQEVFRAEGLPLDLAYVPLIESAFKPNALSRAKAKGMWQFMRGTALENGLQHDWYIDERADPEKATRAAAKYLKTLYSMFGDWHLALASYNGGPGRVQRAIKTSGRTDFWKLSASSRYLPRETRDYVPLILAAIVIAKNPVQYEMEVAPLAAPLFETVTVTGAVDIRRIAEWAGSPVQDIQDLNPELRRWTTPVRETEYELKVPMGTAAVINARLTEQGIDDLAPLSHYTVKNGETLLSISKKLRVSRSDLAEANYLSSKSQLRTGQQLIIPRAPALLAPRTEAPSSDTSEVVLAAAAPSSRPAADEPQTKSTTTHRVARGETLFSIAKRYGTTVESIKEMNNLRSNVIQVGQRLVIERLANLATN